MFDLSYKAKSGDASVPPLSAPSAVILPVIWKSTNETQKRTLITAQQTRRNIGGFLQLYVAVGNAGEQRDTFCCAACLARPCLEESEIL